MKKKTIVIVSLTLVLAILAVAVIATFPTYLFEDTPTNDSSVIQSGNIIESGGESTEGDDIGILSDEDGTGGVEAVLPTLDDEELGYSEPAIEELNAIAEAKGAKVYAETGAFPEGTKVKFKKLGIFDKAYYRSRHYLKGIASEFTAYKFSAKKDGVAVFPDGTVKISFDIPEDYDNTNIAVYYLLERGIQEIDCEVSEDGKTVTVKISQTGVYILAEKDTESVEENNVSSDSDKTESGTSSDASSSADSSSNASSNSSDQSSSNTSSVSSDNSSENGSSNSGNDPEDETLSDGTESDNNGSDPTDDETTSSDNTSSADPNKETMDGWTPWH